MLKLSFSDATLRLSLPFPALSFPARVAIVALLAFAFAWLIAALYRRELFLITRRAARTLLALRLMLMAALGFMLVADPALTTTRTEDVPGRVLMAVDTSGSMRVSDLNRPLAEKLRLVRTLKLASDLAGDSELAAWIAAAETAQPIRFGSDGERARYESVLARIDAASRVDLCQRLLTKDGQSLIEKLRDKFEVDLIGFSPDVAALPTDAVRLKTALEQSSRDARALACTDLKLPLNRAGEFAGDDAAAKLLGVVVLTDGRHNWGASPIPQAQDLGQCNIPVYPVAVAPREAPADVAILSARAAAATVFKGSTVPVDVAVRVTGWPAGAIPVTLAHPDGGSTPLVETIDHKGVDATYFLSFKVKLNDPGPRQLAVTADAGPNDRFADNNRRTVRVNVVKDRARVLLIDGEARWEFHFLHTCLGRDPNMDVRSIVFRQPRLGLVAEEELKAVGTPARKVPEEPDFFAAYDAIVIGDVELAQMTREQRLRLERYVAESGGTLILSAGKRAMPLAYARLTDEPFQKLLPLREPKVIESVEGFPLAFTPSGEKSWFLAMGDTSVESRAAWDRFPLHHWAVTGTLKDGAEALATTANGQPIITRQNFGFGRVLYVGIDSTWRWRFKTGDHYHHRFWGQVAQWAASDRLLPVSNAAGTIRFGPREPVYNGGQDVEIVVRSTEAVKLPSASSRKAARIIRLPATPGGAESSSLATLIVPEGRPRDMLAKVPDLSPGKYAVELDIPEWTDHLVGPPEPDGRAGRLRAFFEVAPADNEEFIDLSANWPLMTDLADATGGKVLTLENATEVVELLSHRTATRTVTQERPLRHSWSTLAVFLVLLAAEWILRKWFGLP